MLSVKEDLLITTSLLSGIAFLFIWKRRFLIDFLIRREEHMARQSNPRQSKIGTRHSSSSEVLTNILQNSEEEHQQKQNYSNHYRQKEGGIVPSFSDYSRVLTSSSSSSQQQRKSNHQLLGISKDPLTIGNNDGSAFGIADRIPSLFSSSSSSSSSEQEQQQQHQIKKENRETSKSNNSPSPAALSQKIDSRFSAKTALASSKKFNKFDLLLPSALFLLKGFDLTESFGPSVPHRHSARLRGGGPLAAALLFPFQQHHSSHNLFHHQQQQRLLDSSSSSSSSSYDYQLVHDAVAIQENAIAQSSLAAEDDDKDHHTRKLQQQQQRVSSSSSSSSSWVEALMLASANVTSRGGERSSEDIERSIESLLFAKRRRQAFDAFNRDKDVPLKGETYDQLLRTFVSDRDHIFTILESMEMHGVYQEVLRSGDRSSLVQAVFEALSIHDYKKAMSAFNIHHANFLKKNNNNSNNNNNKAPVYSGLLSALIQRGMTKEAQSIVAALSDTESERDVATGLIRCLHHEFEVNLANRSSSSQKQQVTGENSAENNNKKKVITDAIDFTNSWLLTEEKKKKNKIPPMEELSSSSSSSSTNSLEERNYTTSLQKSKIGVHARVACSVFAQHPSAFTCSALSKFLLQHYPNGSTPVLKSAITMSLFPTTTTAAMNHHRNKNYNTSITNSGLAASNAAAAASSSLHFARLSISRAINRRGHWQLAASMAQQCLKAKTFEPVGPLAATVARNGKWSAALRLGTQLFALRRAPPTANELSLCVHSSLWSGKWSSALFWVERAHSRGLRFESAVYDAAFVAAAAAASATSSSSSITNQSSILSNRMMMMNDATSQTNDTTEQQLEGKSKNKQQHDKRAANANRLLELSGASHHNDVAITRHNFDAAIRTVKCMAEMGGQCSGESIERLIATAAKMEPTTTTMANHQHVVKKNNNNNKKQQGQEQTESENAKEGQQTPRKEETSSTAASGKNQQQSDGAPKIIDVLCDSGIVDWKL